MATSKVVTITKTLGKVLYKNSLSENEPLREISFFSERKTKINLQGKLENCYKSPIAVSAEKKKD